MASFSATSYLNETEFPQAITVTSPLINDDRVLMKDSAHASDHSSEKKRIDRRRKTRGRLANDPSEEIKEDVCRHVDEIVHNAIYAFALGFVLLIHNESVASDIAGLPPLVGIENGALQLKQKFEQLGFAVLWLKNPTSAYLQAVADYLSSPRIKFPRSYTFFFTYITGHGAYRNFYTKDGSCSYDSIVMMTKKLQTTFKLCTFWFDCCRTIPSHNQGDDDSTTGLPLHPETKMDENTLIVYATSSGRESWGDGDGISFMTKGVVKLIGEPICLGSLPMELRKEIPGLVLPSHDTRNFEVVLSEERDRRMQPSFTGRKVKKGTLLLSVDLKPALSEGSTYMYQNCEVQFRKDNETEWCPLTSISPDATQHRYVPLTEPESSELPASIEVHVQMPSEPIEGDKIEIRVVAHYMGGIKVTSDPQHIPLSIPKVTVRCCFSALALILLVLAIIIVAIVASVINARNDLSVSSNLTSTDIPVEEANGVDFLSRIFFNCFLSLQGWKVSAMDKPIYCSAYNATLLRNNKHKEYLHDELFRQNRTVPPGYYSLPLFFPTYLELYLLAGSKACVSVCHDRLYGRSVTMDYFVLKSDAVGDFKNGHVDQSRVLNRTTVTFDSNHLCHKFNLTVSVSTFVSVGISTMDTLHLEHISGSFLQVYYDETGLDLYRLENLIAHDSTKFIPAINGPHDVLLCYSDSEGDVKLSATPVINYNDQFWGVVALIGFFGVIAFIMGFLICCCSRFCRKRTVTCRCCVC